MLYPRCPSCRSLLLIRQVPYEEGMRKICNNPNLSKEQVEAEKMKLIKSMNLKRPCCTIRILNYMQKVRMLK